MSACVFDVYVRHSDGDVSIIKSFGTNPDDAIYRTREKGDYIPEKDDTVVLCIMVDAPKRQR